MTAEAQQMTKSLALRRTAQREGLKGVHTRGNIKHP
jgi:hypothetical protein